MLDLPRAADVFAKIDADDALSYRLPAAGATAGSVLKHAEAVFEGLHLHNKPMSFKFGFTHDAHFRFHNAKFGYKRGREKFQQMVVIFASSTPTGPAFLEAMLIKLYGGCLTPSR